MMDDTAVVDDRDIAKRLQAYLESEPLPNGKKRHTVNMEKLLLDVVGVTKMSGEDLDVVISVMRELWDKAELCYPQ
jgi:hypothetical protein